MCQLMFSNLHRNDLNALWITHQSILNTANLHKDGFGTYTRSSGVYKTKACPIAIQGLGSKVFGMLSEKEPIIAHVRLASTANKVPSDEMSHPFESEHLILAHNGTLVRQDEKPITSGESDSKYFLTKLEDNFAKDTRIVEALQKTMSEFAGKFAFLIYVKKSGKFYAARGTTAELNVIETEEGTGYVINTNKEDLREGCKRFKLYSSSFGIESGLKFEPVLMKENSIFELKKNSIELIGEIIENAPPEKVTESVWDWRSSKNIVPYDDTYRQEQIKDEYELKVADELYKFRIRYGLSQSELDTIFTATIGLSILESGKEDFNSFIQHIIPRLICSRDFRRKYCAFIDRKLVVPGIGFYEDNKFPFPYMLIRDRGEQRRFLHALEELAVKK